MKTDIFQEKIKRLKLWSNKNPQGPVSAEFHFTDRCNLDCLSCWQYKKKREYFDELNIQQWKEILEQAIDIGIITIYVGGGGEPFYRDDVLVNIIMEAKKKGINGELTTNGTFCDSDIIREIVASGWDSIQMSIDGDTEELQDYLRNQPGVFRKNMTFLRLFNYWKKKLHSTNPVISFHTVISNKNYRNLGGIAKLASEYSCSGIFFQQLVFQNKYCHGLALDKNQRNEVKKILKDISCFAEKLKMQTNAHALLEINDYTRNIKRPKRLFFNRPLYDAFCFEPFTHITIKSNGLVQTCCNPLQEYESVAQKSLKAIWFGKKFESLRKRMIHQNPPKVCCTHPTKRNEQLRLKELLSAEQHES